MMKFSILLTLFTVAFVMTACAASGGWDTAVSFETDQSQDMPAEENQEPTSIPEEEATPTEVPATNPLTTTPPPPTATPALAPLPVIAPAPSWNNDIWINTDTPLPLEDLRGKVVLLEFWTFG